MEYRRLQAADQALMRRLAREPLQSDTASDSDESEGEPEDDPSSDEEVEARKTSHLYQPGHVAPTASTLPSALLIPQLCCPEIALTRSWATSAALSLTHSSISS